jgi:hypothetical protein
MNIKTKPPAVTALCASVAAALCLAAQPVAAQNAPAAAANSVVPDPNPYFLGVSQGLTHDSNVYRIPSGPSDNYSTTSVFGGFEQPISRQKLFGRATVSANRYQDQTSLNNVSYGLNAGVDWETIERLSGRINASLNRSLASPAASVGTPVAARNIAETKSLEATARLGGTSLLTLEAGADYSSLDYSAPQYAAAESRRTSANLNLYYRPGGPLRLGAGIRGDRTSTPNEVVDPVTGASQSTTLNGKHFDLLADYEVTGQIAANGRVSYTRQTSSGAGGGNADFSGITGNVGLNWQTTSKITLRVDAARDTASNATAYNTFAFTPTATGIAFTPVVGLYENNQVTTSAGIGVSYAATAKINTNASLRYARARLTSINAPTPTADIIDVSKVASLGANYEITRNWGAACNASTERREVSGGVAYTYRANTIGCSTQFIWR